MIQTKRIDQNILAKIIDDTRVELSARLTNQEETRKLLKQIDSNNLDNEQIINLAITAGAGTGISALATNLNLYINSDELVDYDSYRVVTLRDVVDYANYCEMHREELIREKLKLYSQLDDESKQMALQLFSLGQDLFAAELYYNLARNAYAVSKEYITINTNI